MTVAAYVAWAILLVAQNAAFTLVSRARNSGSYSFHAAAALASNGVWFASQFILIGAIADLAADGVTWRAVGTGAFYSTFTIAGSVGMHWVSVNYLEKGRRKVGA